MTTRKKDDGPPGLRVLETFGAAALEDAMRFEADTTEREVSDATTALVNVVEEFRKRLADLKASGTLTPKGVTEAARQIAEARLAPETPGPLQRVGVAERDLRGRYRPKLEELRAGLKVERKPGEALVGEMRAAEIRTRLSTMTDTEVLDAYHAAVERGDAEVYSAINDAPGIYKVADDAGPFGIPLTLFQLGVETWETKQDSNLARRFRKLEGMIQRLESTIKVARAEIFELAGIPQAEDPLAKLAEATGARSMAQ